MSSGLASMGAGFADPVHGSQQTFRALLGAMAEPGSLHELPPAALEGLQPEDPEMRPPVGPAMAATLLTLLDAGTPLGLVGELGSEPVRGWVRFHTGARDIRSTSGFTVARAADVDAALRERLDLGSDEAPQSSATLIVEVQGVSDRPACGMLALTLRGAGVDGVRRLGVNGLDADFWRWRIALQAEFPRGIDLILVSGRRIAAIPRSTRVALEA